MTKKFVFRPVYSWLLVPLTFILYVFVPVLRPYLIPLMTCVAIIGMVAIILYSGDEPMWQRIASFIFHAILLIGLLQITKLNLNNLFNYILFILSVLFIFITPHWPYKMSRQELGYIYIITYSSVLYLNSLFYNFKIIKKKKI